MMFTKILKGVMFLALAAGLVFGSLVWLQPGVVSAAAPEGRGGPGGGGFGGGGRGGTGVQTGTSVSLSPLSAAEKDVLQQAILEEYGAYNLYQAVIQQFGNVAPFAQIVRSEQQHINALVRQAQKYGVAVPANPGLSAPLALNSLSEAYAAGVAAEKADAALYDQLKPSVTHTDLLQVFGNLQSASLNSHLPAFQAYQ